VLARLVAIWNLPTPAKTAPACIVSLTPSYTMIYGNVHRLIIALSFDRMTKIPCVLVAGMTGARGKVLHAIRAAEDLAPEFRACAQLDTTRAGPDVPARGS
jgi:hypothetical protein